MITWVVLAHYKPNLLAPCVASIYRIKRKEDQVVLCLNQPTPEVMAQAWFLSSRFDFQVSIYHGHETPAESITPALNKAFEMYDKGQMFIKIDEDFLVNDPRIPELYLKAYKKNPICVSSLINVNDFGGAFLTRRLWMDDYWKNFGHDPSDTCPGEFMTDITHTQWIWEKTKDLDATLRTVQKFPPYAEVRKRYGCGIMGLYKKDWDIFSQKGPWSEEYDLGLYLEKKERPVIVCTNTIAFHFASMDTYETMIDTPIYMMYLESFFAANR